ncbi:MAG: hypothetical protein K940chlam7_00500 [Chlamydiae bacterium]|nr:hypothetical protein [Chlamydiota bacterium]
MKSYVSNYIRKSIENNENKTHRPPTESEIRFLFKHLRENDLDPIIVGSIALIQHLRPSKEDYGDEGFRYTQDIDIFVSSSLPRPPPAWRRDHESLGVVSWISPSGGYIDFLEAGHIYPSGHRNPYHIDKDLDSIADGLPVADLASIFVMKLNSDRVQDLTDLVNLAKKRGIPKDLARKKLNEQQKENLESIKIWIGNGI